MEGNIENMGVIKKKAIFSQDKKYRYVLERELNKGSNNVCFIMLNPSIADDKIDDPTLKRVISFSKKFNAKRIWVVNLFAFVTSNPKNLQLIDDPIGKENDLYLKKYIELSDIIVLGWGKKGSFLNRDKYVLKTLEKFRDKVYALKILKDGSPAHPLYLKNDLIPIKYFEKVDK